MNHTQFILLIITFKFAQAIINDKPVLKGCPVLKQYQENITMSSISGKWYEIQKHNSSITTGRCVTVDIDYNSATKTVQLRYTQILNTAAVFTLTANVTKSNLWTFSYEGYLNGE
jgi:lipocalin